MHVLAVNQFYAPDLAATSQLLTELCEDLVRGGDRVTVVASRGSYLGGGRLPARETIAGVEVIRPFATSFGKRSVAHRLADYGSFGATALARLATAARPDVMLVLTTPPMIASGAALVARARRIPLVAWVQDVYPEVAVELGVLPPSGASRLLASAARMAHRAARLSVALSDGMATRIERQGQERARIRVIPNWADGRAIRPLARGDNGFRREHGLDECFVAMYSGNLGAGHELETFVAAARALETRRSDFRMLFVGEGARRAEAEAMARGLSNVRFLPYQPRERLAESLSAADVHLASLRPGLEGLLVPSKLYGILAAGRPLVFVGPEGCELARVIREDRVGWRFAPGDVDGVTEALCHAAEHRQRTAAMGEAARRLFEERYDRPIAITRWRNALSEAAAGG